MLMALLCDIVAIEGCRLRIGVPLTILIWQRVCRLARRFAWLAANGPASLRARAKSAPRHRSPEPAPKPQPPAAPPDADKPKLPALRGFGWLSRVLPSNQVGAARNQLEYLLAQSYIVDLIEANPTLGLVLRPLCDMLGAKLPTILRRIPADPADPANPAPPRPKRLRPSHPRRALAPDPDPIGAAVGNPYFQNSAC